ncbi:hypothetical protein EJ05DRAFT_500125 [Pseudovirgaria hyperparasitica]|uniref:Uncharacterized protein n=1 Tax=Pseudovirgaria hyperparasitica TaxID=470096 RepID=A0A6A6W7U0_9PEZI|nr:uncharacterized protein EJ05DRAFT_500125 [Pseudovirgaria hyperparasitica]KAF2758605.1 hypothetical protein EJ05DRAFT_500125 [Pseudovirgaria hyperparasitica]
MVSFKKIFTAAVAVSVPVTMAATAADVISGLNDVTTRVKALQTTVNQLTSANAAIIFPQIVSGLTTVTTGTTTAVGLVRTLPTVSSATDTTAILSALTGMTTATQTLITSLTAKVALLKNIPGAGALLNTAVQALTSGVSSLLSALTSAVASGASQISTLTSTVTGLLQSLLSAISSVLAKREAQPISRIMRGVEGVEMMQEVAVEA